MRPETGTMKFGDDWTGVFIRGDNAQAFMVGLRHLLKATEDTTDPPLMIARAQVESLRRLLNSSNEHDHAIYVQPQFAKLVR